eukprot:7376626-Prymnesium_polylepis.1
MKRTCRRKEQFLRPMMWRLCEGRTAEPWHAQPTRGPCWALCAEVWNCGACMKAWTPHRGTVQQTQCTNHMLKSSEQGEWMGYRSRAV